MKKVATYPRRQQMFENFSKKQKIRFNEFKGISEYETKIRL